MSAAKKHSRGGVVSESEAAAAAAAAAEPRKPKPSADSVAAGAAGARRAPRHHPVGKWINADYKTDVMVNVGAATCRRVRLTAPADVVGSLRRAYAITAA